MVHVKRVELTNFKSFGGTTKIPLLPGFTVVSGPNGSGKSNILDALLFCLGLASSRGMRAERLPDLVNHDKATRGKSAVETLVTVTFDLEGALSREQEAEGTKVNGNGNGNGYYVEELEDKGDKEDTVDTGEEEPLTPHSSLLTSNELTITRRLRVTQQGSYTSTYYINGSTCTQTELHEQLSQIRIYPEGYNVVLQGDVTSIISMHSRERREIIDELAGVANYDRKIIQAKETLNEVKDREDRYRIVETELITQRDRLSHDRIQAEKYQKLRIEYQQKQQWEIVLVWRSLQQQQEKLVAEIQTGDRTLAELTTQLTTLNTQIQQVTAELDALNARVKTLGEEELLSLQSTLATQEAERRQLQNRQRDLTNAYENAGNAYTQQQLEIQQHQNSLVRLQQQQQEIVAQLSSLRQQRDEAQQTLEQSRTEASAVADASDAWVQQQAALSRQVESLLQTVEPQRTEQAQLKERSHQLEKQIQEQTGLIQTLEPELATKQTQLTEIETQLSSQIEQIQSLAQSLAAAEAELQIQQQTQNRLLQEQRDKQRQLDKLEAQSQALQETQGTFATKILLQSGLSGICGLVAQLGKVEPRYQLALEIAAGARLGQLVVEDDGVAASGIEILKQKRGGRVTFLPLNKIQAPRFSPASGLRYANGYIDYAINLIECDRRYQDIFGYVFGSTVVFADLQSARSHLGQYRIVTLAGELLETSGAMTGGSISQQNSSLHFGTSDATESQEVIELRNRLQEIDRILARCGESIGNLAAKTKNLSQELTEAKTKQRENNLLKDQLQKEIRKLIQQVETGQSQLAQNTKQLSTVQARLETLERDLPAQEEQLQQLRQALVELEQSQTNSQWQQIQAAIRQQEQELQTRIEIVRNAEQQLKDIENQTQRLHEKIQECEVRSREYQQQQQENQAQQAAVNAQLQEIGEHLKQIHTSLKEIEQRMTAERQARDRAEQQLRELHLDRQQVEWQQQKLQETQTSRREDLVNLQAQIQIQAAEMPDPLPEVPDKVDLEQLQKELRSLVKRMEAMEPVNMLALEEYERTNARLEELSQKLLTLEAERTELLLRIENFTTLRQRAFQEAFDAVNENFQSIFATLSDGDGFLQLDNPEDPFTSGLNLVAHPKGKPVQRLASMSGGEKSLTALSFIFALQRYRPSPFYAFDEVDMFLDGANVERLARMIEQQAKQAQFIVVSLRRPMIESAERTIGVTQARGAYTQVLGIKL
ncbi:chromosome segregation protein SMC [Cyanosarcina cf. burmensis CCALA 770]|nr:chromosome segregation protein SMC [Cyanosarcina cf. burmensis CCALA 770]